MMNLNSRVVSINASSKFKSFASTSCCAFRLGSAIQLFTICLILGVSTAQGALVDGLAANWTFDEVAGSFADATGNGHTGTPQSMPWGNGANGKFGGALDLDGVGDHVDSSIDISGFTAISWSVWIQTSDTAARAFSLQHSASDDIRIFIGTSGTHHLATDDGTAFNTSLPDSINDGDWHLVVGTFDGSTVTSYFDGAFANSIGSASFNFATATGALSFGAQATSNANPLAGLLDEIGIWNRALSPAEVSELWNGGAGRTIIPAVPEPSTSFLLGLGLVGFTFRRRSRFSRSALAHLVRSKY